MQEAITASELIDRLSTCAADAPVFFRDGDGRKLRVTDLVTDGYEVVLEL